MKICAKIMWGGVLFGERQCCLLYIHTMYIYISNMLAVEELMGPDALCCIFFIMLVNYVRK